MQISLRNDAPASAESENRTYVSVYSPFALAMTPPDVSSTPELNRRAHAATMTIPSEQSRTLTLDVEGRIELGPDNWYRLDLPHQASLAPDDLDISLAVPNGWRIVETKGFVALDDRHGVARLLASDRQQLAVRLERTAWSRLWARTG